MKNKSRSNDQSKINIQYLDDILTESELKQFEDDTELWESGKLGASAKHAVPISDDEEKALDDSLGLQSVTMRLQKELVERLKTLAKKEGLGYQPYIRQLLTRHVRDIVSEAKIRKSA